MTKKALASLVVDRSGSMGSIRGEAQGALDSYVTDQAKLSIDTDDLEIQVMLRQFDNVIEQVYEPISAPLAPPYELLPRGMTALYDAIATGLIETNRQRKKIGVKHNAVSFVVITDGFENASKEYGGEKGQSAIKELVAKYTKKGWDIQFLAGDLEAAKFGQSVGIAGTVNFDPKVRGAYRGMTASASAQSMDYFVTDAGDDKDDDDA